MTNDLAQLPVSATPDVPKAYESYSLALKEKNVFSVLLWNVQFGDQWNSVSWRIRPPHTLMNIARQRQCIEYHLE